jgi:hypothetical protein
VARLARIVAMALGIGVAASDDAWAPTFGMNVGVARDWEISYAAQPSWIFGDGPDTGFAFVENALAVERVLREGALQDRPGAGVAVEAAALLPGTSPFERFGARLAPIVSVEGHGFVTHLGGEIVWTRENEVALGGSVIVEAPELLAGLRPGFEATTGWEAGYGRAWSGLVGLIWRPREDLCFDVGFRLGRAAETSTREIRADFTWAIRVWGDVAPVAEDGVPLAPRHREPHGADR